MLTKTGAPLVKSSPKHAIDNLTSGAPVLIRDKCADEDIGVDNSEMMRHVICAAAVPVFLIRPSPLLRWGSGEIGLELWPPKPMLPVWF